jgi:C-terminal processing protease CtpA/Prc
MNENTQSAGEYYVMALRMGRNVTVIGQNSVGSDGALSAVPLPDGNLMLFSGDGILTPNGGQTQRVGLSPDIRVAPTIQGISEGRDELMEAAVAFLLGQ